MASKGMLRGRGGSLGAYGVKNGVLGIPWGHRVDLMSLLLIHICLYIMLVYVSDPDFASGRTDGWVHQRGSRRGSRGPKNKNGFYNSASKVREEKGRQTSKFPAP